MRLTKHIKALYPQLSQRLIKELIENGDVLVNGYKTKLHTMVSGDEKIEIDEKFLQTSLKSNVELACETLKETDDYIIFSKPAGIHSVAQKYWETDTVANWLLSKTPNADEISSPLESGLIHRLDRDTSGVMIAAKNLPTYDQLTGMMRDQKINKTYTCIVTGKAPEQGSHYALNVSRAKGAPTVKLEMIDEETANEFSNDMNFAHTRVLDIQDHEKGHLLQIKLITGVRHQIRAHLAALSSPILGDELYGGEPADRLYLHATSLEFKDPLTGEKININSPANFN
jgi:23S rRNA pseudouridine1911/1915/1917 synthase